MIRVKNNVSTQKNKWLGGKIGKFIGKTNNNMFILEIKGNTYNFYKKDLDIKDHEYSSIKIKRSRKKKKCKKNEEISKNTGRCILKCKKNQYRNEITNRCVKIEPSTPKRTIQKRSSKKSTKTNSSSYQGTYSDNEYESDGYVYISRYS